MLPFFKKKTPWGKCGHSFKGDCWKTSAAAQFRGLIFHPENTNQRAVLFLGTQLLTHQHWSSHVLCTCAFWAHFKNWILNLPWCFSDEFSPSWSCRLVTESLWTQSNRRAEHVVSDHSLPVACAAPERIKELQNPFPPKPDKIVY